MILVIIIETLYFQVKTQTNIGILHANVVNNIKINIVRQDNKVEQRKRFIKIETG